MRRELIYCNFVISYDHFFKGWITATYYDKHGGYWIPDHPNAAIIRSLKSSHIMPLPEAPQ